MEAEQGLQFIRELLAEKGLPPLSDNERHLFLGNWEGKSYKEIVSEYSVTCKRGQLQNIGGKLWNRLSDTLEEKVSMGKIRGPVETAWRKRQRETFPEPGANEAKTALPNPIIDVTDPAVSNPPSTEDELLEEPVLLDSHFYIERHNVESSCCEKIKPPGALLRLKSPQKMGKTSVLERVIAELEEQGYKFARLSFDAVDRKVLSSFYNLTRYICTRVSKELEMDNQIAQRWDDNLDCIGNVVSYFQKYLLLNRSDPLVIVLDDFDCVFEQLEVATDTCRLLKRLYNLARRSGARGAIFKKLRFIVVHSTDFYSSLDINHSPLNGIGYVVTLKEFNEDEVIKLTHRYNIDFSANEIEQLMNLIGGHPYLLRLALKYISDENSLEELLQIALKASSPFRNHLQILLETLQQDSKLVIAFLKVAKANEPVELRSNEEFKLERLGLLKAQDNGWISSCNLYSQYFLRQLKD